jgi:DNA-binding Lrp family transcriptional regulator
MVMAYVLCGVSPGSERTVLKKLREISEEAHIIYGQYDIIAKITVDQCEDLEEFIFDKLRTIDEVQHTETWIAMD